MRVAVVGMGHVGAVTAACLARDGHDVACFDIDPLRQDAVRTGNTPVDEPGLDVLFAHAFAAGRLRGASDLADALAGVGAVVVAVGTPGRIDGRPDLGQVEAAGRAIGAGLASDRTPPVAILRSTVPPGTTGGLFARSLLAGSGGTDLPLVHLPEFFREGSAVDDWHAGRFCVVGSADAAGGRLVADLFGGTGPVHHTDLRTAEALKYACNAWHATKVAFANEIGRFATISGAQPDELASLFLQDAELNLGPAYLQPGFAYGGPCLAKDLAALLRQAGDQDLDLPLLSATAAANETTIAWWADQVRASNARQIAILGLVHRAGSRDLRASPYLELAETLSRSGCQVTLFEPALRAPPALDFPLPERITDALAGAELVLRAREEIASLEAIDRACPGVRVVDLFRLQSRPGAGAG